MKRTYTIIALLALGAGLSAHAEAVPGTDKDAKSAIIITKDQSKEASTTPKTLKKQQDPIVSLMETLANSIDKVTVQIDSLSSQGADTGEAEGLIFDAKLRLHTVELNLNATTTASVSAATSTPKKSRDAVRKKAIEDLKMVYIDVLNAIKSLKKTILAERVMLSSSDTDSGTAVASPTSTSTAATSTATSTDETATSTDTQTN